MTRAGLPFCTLYGVFTRWVANKNNVEYLPKTGGILFRPSPIGVLPVIEIIYYVNTSSGKTYESTYGINSSLSGATVGIPPILSF